MRYDKRYKLLIGGLSLSYWLGKMFGRLFVLLPKSIQDALVKVLGLLAWLGVSSRRKQAMIKDVEQALGVPRREAERIAKASVTRLSRMLPTMFLLPRLTGEEVRKRVRFHGLEHFDRALSLQKGVVLASAHFGDWELLGCGLAAMGYPIVAVIRPQKNEEMDRLVQEYRSSIPGGIILEKTDVRGIVRQLKNNRAPFILMDQDALDAGVFVRFFGRKASTPPGAAVLARLAGAPIVTAFISEGDDGIHDLYFGEPLFIDPSGDKEEQTVTMMQRLTAELEKHVRRSPEEWFWLQERWRTRPKDSE